MKAAFIEKAARVRKESVWRSSDQLELPASGGLPWLSKRTPRGRPGGSGFAGLPERVHTSMTEHSLRCVDMENSTIRSRKARPRTLASRRATRPSGGARLEADGETHRRDCECPRCDTGFAPSDQQRRLAERRARTERARAAVAREHARRQERVRLRQMELQAFFRQSNAATDAEVKRLRALRERSLADRRLDLLLRLRNAGIPLTTALEEVERAMPAASSVSGADNDNGARDNAPRNDDDTASPPPNRSRGGRG